jgi:hypothetical protein
MRILSAGLIVFSLLTPASASPASAGRRRPTIRYFIATAYSVRYGRFRQMVASGHCGRRLEGIAPKQPQSRVYGALAGIPATIP